MTNEVRDAFDEAFDEQPADKAAPEAEVKEETPDTEDSPEPKPEGEESVESAAETGERPGEENPPEKAEEKPRIDPEQFRGYLDEREKRQKLEAELEALRRQATQQQQQKPKEPPSVYDDPEGYQRHLESEYDSRLRNQKLETSEFMARRDFGDDLVNEVRDWAARLPPSAADHLVGQPSPFHAAVEAYRKEQASAALREHDYDLEKLKEAWLKEHMAAKPDAQQADSGQAKQPEPETGSKLPPKVVGSGGLVGKEPVMPEGERFNRFFSS